MDSRPVVTFSHAVADRGAFGQPAAYVSDPAPETVGDHEVTYSLTGVELDYRPFGGGAFTPVDDLYGVWLLEGAAPADDPAEAEAGGERVTTKLEVWGRTPFSYEDHTTAATLSVGIVADPGFPCGPDVQLTLTCADWEDVPARTRYPLQFEHEGLEFLANRFSEVALERSRSADDGLRACPGAHPRHRAGRRAARPVHACHDPRRDPGTLHHRGVGSARGDGGDAGVAVGLRAQRRTLEFDVEGTEWLVYRAETSEDCGPGRGSSRSRTSPRRAAPEPPGGPEPPPTDAGPGTGAGSNPDPETPEGGEGAVVPDDANLPRPVTTVPCCTLLYQVCWLQETLVEAADQLEERRESFMDWTDVWSGSARVFGPNTTYRLTATVEAAGIGDPATFTRTVYFRTQGPPGFLAQAGDGKGLLLADLALYADRTSPPEGAGLRLDAPPHYCGHDLVVLYNRDHVKELYAGKLFLQLVDANGTAVVGSGGGTLFEADFTDPAHRVLTTGETVFVEAIDGADCSSVTTATVSRATPRASTCRSWLPPPSTRPAFSAAGRRTWAWTPTARWWSSTLTRSSWPRSCAGSS